MIYCKKEHLLLIEEQQPKILQYYDQLNGLEKHEAGNRVSELNYISKYTTNSNLRVAHNNFADNDKEIDIDPEHLYEFSTLIE